jgi:hypothetical protein
MKALLNSNINDLTEVKAALNGVEIKEADIDDLIVVLLHSNNMLVCNMIAHRLKDFKDNRILNTFIMVISRPDNFNKRAKIIYCCNGFDCTRYFDLFIQIVVEEHGESCINAMDVISDLKGRFLTINFTTPLIK